MATKTVVCPECGAGAAPGRYACAECGALLAAVGTYPRRWESSESVEVVPEPAVDANGAGSHAGSEPEAEAEPEPTLEPEPEPAPAPAREPAGEPAPIAAAVVVPAPDAVPAPAAAPAAEAAPAPEPKPRSRAPWKKAPTSQPEPEPTAEVSWPERPMAPIPTRPVTPAAPMAPAPARPVPAVLGLNEPDPAAPGSAALDDEFEDDLDDDANEDDFEDDLDDDAPVAAARVAVSASVWPPEGAPRPGPIPTARTPAGAYLSPSAVLPPLDAPAAPRPPAAVAAAVAPETGGTSEPRASLAETLGAIGMTEDVPRRLIGAGAAVAGLGFLLPWAAVLAGNGLGGSYWSRWGLAGPGHWIIVAALIACVVVALTGDRLERVPIGPIAVVLAAVLIGLLWPYVFGVFERFVGVWLVLAGTILLGIGGILDVRRHDPEEPPV